MLDDNKCTIDIDDEVIIPDNPMQHIKNAINGIRSDLSVGSYFKAEEIVRRDRGVIDGVERFWLETIGQYRRYLTKDLAGAMQFNKDLFIKQSLRSLRPVRALFFFSRFGCTKADSCLIGLISFWSVLRHHKCLNSL